MNPNIHSHGNAIYYLLSFKSEYRGSTEAFVVPDSVINDAIRVIKFQHDCNIPIHCVVMETNSKCIKMDFSIGTNEFIMWFCIDGTRYIDRVLELCND